MRLAMLLCAGVLITLPVMGTENNKAVFAKHWQMAKEFTLAVADAMPAEDYNFKPVAEEMSFGQLMMHIAAQNSDSCATAIGAKPLPGLSSERMPPDTDKQTAIRFLTLSFDKCANDLQAMPADQWDKEVTDSKANPSRLGRHCCTRLRTWHIIAVRRKCICASRILSRHHGAFSEAATFCVP